MKTVYSFNEPNLYRNLLQMFADWPIQHTHNSLTHFTFGFTHSLDYHTQASASFSFWNYGFRFDLNLNFHFRLGSIRHLPKVDKKGYPNLTWSSLINFRFEWRPKVNSQYHIRLESPEILNQVHVNLNLNRSTSKPVQSIKKIEEIK